MLFDEETPGKPKRLLEDMSIEELKERIVDLKDQIAACEAQITKKEASRQAADAAFFKSS
ncbi:MAG: DUF1192 domain-containing protein [Hyphomonadaceae bacterium]